MTDPRPKHYDPVNIPDHVPMSRGRQGRHVSFQLPPAGRPLSRAEEDAIFAAKALMSREEWLRYPGRHRAITANILLIPLTIKASKTIPRYHENLASHLLGEIVKCADRFAPDGRARFGTFVGDALWWQSMNYQYRHESLIHVPPYHFQKKTREAARPETAEAGRRAFRTKTGGTTYTLEAGGHTVFRSRAQDAPEYGADEVGLLTAAIDALDPREAEAVRRYYGIGCEPVGDKEIAAGFGVTRSRTQVIRHQALAKLRKRLTESAAS